MTRNGDGRRGIALLEALVALTILATAGLSIITLLHQAITAESAARAAETTMGAADRVLVAMTLLNRAELDQRIGMHPVGEFLVAVQRPERSLYRIAIAEAAYPLRELLVTVVYRVERERS